jgi:hypothetical protein
MLLPLRQCEQTPPTHLHFKPAEGRACLLGCGGITDIAGGWDWVVLACASDDGADTAPPTVPSD